VKGAPVRRLLLTAVAASSLVLPALTTAASASSANAVDGQNQAAIARVCPAPPNGYASCHALRNDAAPAATSTPAGYGPSDIRSAYGLGATASGARTVAIVDAYDDPTAASDLTTYRAQYGLPTCGTGCFTKVNQSGGTTPPRKDGGWAQEISLDLDMVSAACPDCKILLVEASSASFANLGAAVATAQRLGASAISNSYGGSDAAEGTSSAYRDAALAGIAVTASTGDNGYGVESPASYDSVVAVGGTSLTRAATSRGWSETAWSGAGSGCSTLNSKPSWQTAATQCKGKANADVSAVADPNTGVAVYDSTAYQGHVGWMVFGGTSASSPIIASVYAQAPAFAKGTYAATLPWGNTAALNDVKSGSNGTCSTAVWCNAAAGTGWDGPTGLGTPNGIGAF
jgi:subtilase family serine protease